MSNPIPITERTKQLAIRIVKACSFLDEKPGVARTLSRQLLRSGTSIEFGIRKSEVRSKFNSDFRLPNSDFSSYWLEILIESGIVEAKKFQMLLQEVGEITAILVASTRKLKEK